MNTKRNLTDGTSTACTNAEKGRGGRQIFLRYLLAITFSTLGIWVQRVGLGWTAWEITQSAFWTGAISSLTLAPSLILTPLFGVLADRIRLRQAMPFIFAAFIAVGAALAGLSATDLLGRGTLLFIALVFGVTTASYHPFRLTIPARIDVALPLARIVSAGSIIFHTSGIVGPAIAGLLLATAGRTAVFLAACGFFCLYVLIFSTLRFRERRNPPERLPFLAELHSGMRAALAIPELLAAVATVMISGAVGRAVIEMLPAITGAVVGGASDSFALLVTMTSLGAIISGATMTALSHSLTGIRIRMFAAALGAMALTAGFGAYDGYPVFMAACTLLGFSVTMVAASSQSLLQIVVDDDYRGRVMSFWTMAAFGGPALGVLAIGALGDAIGLRTALALTGTTGSLLILAVVALDVVGRRRSASELPHG